MRRRTGRNGLVLLVQHVVDLLPRHVDRDEDVPERRHVERFPVRDLTGLFATGRREPQRGANAALLNDELRLQPDEASRLILYRVAQEALTNARKHARASEVEVVIAYRDGGFLLRVTDDGVGFVPETPFSTPGHLGLVAMRERVELAGGAITIDSAPGTGTVVDCWIPAAIGDPDGNPTRR